MDEKEQDCQDAQESLDAVYALESINILNSTDRELFQSACDFLCEKPCMLNRIGLFTKND